MKKDFFLHIHSSWLVRDHKKSASWISPNWVKSTEVREIRKGESQVNAWTNKLSTFHTCAQCLLDCHVFTSFNQQLCLFFNQNTFLDAENEISSVNVADKLKTCRELEISDFVFLGLFSPYLLDDNFLTLTIYSKLSPIHIRTTSLGIMCQTKIF